MEATGIGTLLRRVPVGFRPSSGDEPMAASRAGPMRVRIGNGCFRDEGHLRYYASKDAMSSAAARCGLKEEEKKRRKKVVKGLERDLSALFTMGLGVENKGEDGMVGEIKGQIISEAAELLLAQLNQLRSDAKEMKKRRKQGKAATKSAKNKNNANNNSSTSSESSDSEFETQTLLTVSSPRTIETKPDKSSNPIRGAKPLNKIEVCMGGECKKSGGTELLAELEKEVGVEGAVVGCKCMGKCRDGPNVRVLNQTTDTSLCIGVGLEDVGSIAAKFFRENKDIGLLIAR